MTTKTTKKVEYRVKIELIDYPEHVFPGPYYLCRRADTNEVFRTEYISSFATFDDADKAASEYWEKLRSRLGDLCGRVVMHMPARYVGGRKRPLLKGDIEIVRSGV